MATLSDLAVVMALRVRGRGDAAEVARAVGCREIDAAAALAALQGRGIVVPVASAPPGVVALTDAGRDELASLLAAERLDRHALAALYDRFLVADRELKSAITAWQLAADAEKPARRSAVLTSAAHAEGVARALATSAPRVAPYAARIATAGAAIARGDTRFVASPRVDALHQVWFELHEDLLATLGRSRST